MASALTLDKAVPDARVFVFTRFVRDRNLLRRDAPRYGTVTRVTERTVTVAFDDGASRRYSCESLHGLMLAPRRRSARS
jgi:hypothetical protein